MTDTVSVAGRNPHTIIKICKDLAEANRVASEMIADGARSVTVDNEPFEASDASKKGADE